jgi:hypothetical protein
MMMGEDEVAAADAHRRSSVGCADTGAHPPLALVPCPLQSHCRSVAGRLWGSLARAVVAALVKGSGWTCLIDLGDTACRAGGPVPSVEWWVQSYGDCR